MAKLRSITNNTLNSLPPATLHKLGVFFTSKGSNFNLAPEPRLESCEVNERKMPRQQELRELYTQYKLEFLREMDKLNAAETADADVLLLAHYLHLGCNNSEYTDKVESLLPDLPRRGGSDAEYLVQAMLHYNGEKALSKASLMLASSRLFGYEYFVVDERALPFTLKPNYEAGADFDRAFEDNISEGIQKRYGTGICRVRSQMKNELWVVEITHGGAKRKEANENNSKTVDVLRQPIEVDCLIYDTRFNDIRIHMESKSVAVLEIYCKGFGTTLFDNPLYWHSKPKYNLDHFNLKRDDLQQLLARGADRLSNPQVGKLNISISSVSYAISHRLYGGVETTDKYTKRNSHGLNNSMGYGEYLVPIESTITSISLKFSHGSSKTKSIQITLTHKRRTLESEAIPGIEDWLYDEGFSRRIIVRPDKAYNDFEETSLEVAEGTDDAQ